MLRKVLLMTPGPTPVPPEVSAKEGAPIIHHRTAEFREIIGRVEENLKKVFKTKNYVLFFASSGTGAMEGAVSNTLSQGDKALVPIAGKFSERWAEICKAYGVEVIPIEVEWTKYGDIAQPEEIKKQLDNHPDIKAVFVPLCETSTGTVFPIKEYGEIVRERENTILVVDAISGLLACDIQVDNWSVDVCVAGSQKGIMLPPGLSFASVSEKAWKFVEKSTLPKYYFDFKKSKKSLEESDTPFTPAVSLIRALDVALDMIIKEGVDEVLRRHEMLAEATREGVKAIGLTLFSKYPANVLTAINRPDGIDVEAFRKHLNQKYGIHTAAGQAHLKGKIFRIAHLGYMNQCDILATIGSVELALKDVGYPVKIGEGVKAAQEVFAKFF